MLLNTVFKKVLDVLSTLNAKELSKLWDIHIKPGHTRTLSLDDVHLFLAGSSVDTRIHLNPSKRLGVRKLRSNFRSIKIDISLQYNNNFWEPCQKRRATLQQLLLFGVVFVSKNHLPWCCWRVANEISTLGPALKSTKPTGYSNWAAGAKQGTGLGWSMEKIMLESKGTKAAVPLLLRPLWSSGSTGWGHPTRHQHEAVSH